MKIMVFLMGVSLLSVSLAENLQGPGCATENIVAGGGVIDTTHSCDRMGDDTGLIQNRIAKRDQSGERMLSDDVKTGETLFKNAGSAGKAGAPWSEAEVIAVKKKLYETMFSTGTKEKGKGGAFWSLNHNNINAAKVLRLSFHDCLKYKGGIGGCDGCLDWHGVGYRKTFAQDRKRPNFFFGNNNGLENTVETLEQIYTMVLPELEVSLAASGKSRADLWAFAGIVAVEFSIHAQNLVCSGKRFLAHKGNGGAMCLQTVDKKTFIGHDGCVVSYSTPIEFKTGRRDCAPVPPDEPRSDLWGADEPYKTAKHEEHPSPFWGGKQITKWMHKNFNFNGQETVAIMGAHTIGSFNRDTSGFKYTWTSKQEAVFNNEYYRNMVGTRSWMHEDDECTPLGDAWGQPPKAKYVAKAQWGNENGGPVQWIRWQHTCPNCVSKPWNRKWVRYAQRSKDVWEDCCKNNIPEGAFCRPDNDRAPGADLEETPADAKEGWRGKCESWRFIYGRDEAFLSTDYGLYKDFQVDNITGFPYGCVGLEKFNEAGFEEQRRRSQTYAEIEWEEKDGGDGKRYVAEPKCPFQTFSLNSDPLHEIVERYAQDQTLWVDDFARAMEKMLANGYQTLTRNDAQPSQVSCPWPTWQALKYHDPKQWAKEQQVAQYLKCTFDPTPTPPVTMTTTTTTATTEEEEEEEETASMYVE